MLEKLRDQSPLDCLPEEILGIILALAAEEVDVTEAPAIVRVCRKWRRISLGSKDAWTSVRIPGSASVSAVSKVLSLSGNRKLSLDLSDFLPPLTHCRSEYTRIIKLVLAEASRWQFARLNVDMEFGFDDLFTPSSPLARAIRTSLEGLEVVLPFSPGLQPHFVAQIVETLSAVPAMRQLRLSGIYRGESRIAITQLPYWTPLCTKVAPACFSTLTHISLSGGPTLHDCVTVLTHCSRALEAQFEGIKPPPGGITTLLLTGITKTRLRYLRSLNVAARSDASVFLRYFECPRLERLFISNGPMEPDFSSANRSIWRYHFNAIQGFIVKCALLQQLVLDINGTWQLAMAYFDRCSIISSLLESEITFVASPSDSDADAREYSSFNDRNGLFYYRGTRDGKATVAHKRRVPIQKAHTGGLSPHTWGTAFWVRKANETSESTN